MPRRKSGKSATAHRRQRGRPRSGSACRRKAAPPRSDRQRLPHRRAALPLPGRRDRHRRTARHASDLRRGEGARRARRRGLVGDRAAEAPHLRRRRGLARRASGRRAAATCASMRCWSRRARCRGTSRRRSRRKLAAYAARSRSKNRRPASRMRLCAPAEICRRTSLRRHRMHAAVSVASRDLADLVGGIGRAARRGLDAACDSCVAAPCSVTAAAIALEISPISRIVRLDRADRRRSSGWSPAACRRSAPRSRRSPWRSARPTP